ncbi:MAG: hypothetical protein ACYTGH_12550, partial [Planctomycetota bacterium]
MLLLLGWGERSRMLAAEENRRVLILYDSTEGPADQSYGHRYLEMPINRVGLITEYHDVAIRPLPEASLYRGIVVWFQDERMQSPVEYCAWLARAIRGGTRVLAMGGTGATETEEGEPVRVAVVRQPEEAFGLIRSAEVPYSDSPLLVQVEARLKQHFGFETRRSLARPYYLCFRSQRKDLRFWKVVRRTDIQGSDSPVVAVGEQGAWVTDTRHAIRFVEQPIFHGQWDVNPFRLVEAAFHTKGVPRPDVTTAFGSRAAFAHIDGDGVDNMSQDLPGKPRKASQVVRDEILTRYPVPIT